MKVEESKTLGTRVAVMNVVVAFLASMFAATIFLAFGVLLRSLEKSFSISTTEAAVIYFAQWLAFGLTSWGLGLFSDRIGTKATIRLGFLVILLGMLLSWISFNYVTFVVGFGVMTGAGLSAAFGPLHNLIMATTEQRWRGTALGVVMAAQGVGPVAFLPAISALEESSGLKTVTTVLVVASVVLVAISLLLRDVDRSEDREEDDAGGEGSGGVILVEDPRSHGRPNLKVTLAHLLGCASHTIPLVYVVEMATDTGGLSQVKAASILSVISAASVISRLGAPAVGNAIGGVEVLLATLPLQVVGMGLFILFQDGSLALYYVAGFVFGLGFGGEMVLFSLISRQMFEGKIGGILGVQLLGAGIGMGAGVLAAGLMLTAGASHAATFWLAIVVGLVAEAASYFMRQPEPIPA